MWRIESETDPTRWVEDDGDAWQADTTTEAELSPLLRFGAPVLATVTGPMYEPTDLDDDLGAFLHAIQIIPGPHRVTGDPPILASAPSDEGALEPADSGIVM